MAARHSSTRSCVHAALVEDSSWSAKSLRSAILNDVSSVQSSMLALRLASSLTKGCYGSAHICARMIYHLQPWILRTWKMAFGHFTAAERCCGCVCQWCHKLPLGLQAKHRIAPCLGFSAYKQWCWESITLPSSCATSALIQALQDEDCLLLGLRGV